MKNMHEYSDEQLVVSIWEDHEQYVHIVKRYEGKLLRYATRMVGDEQDAKDIVQESFISAYKNLRSFDPKLKFSSWMYRIVHNRSVNFLRAKKHHVSIEKTSWVQNIGDDTEAMEDTMQKDEIIAELKICLSQLPVEYRSPLTLFYLEDQSYEEISDVLRIPMGTVATRISRGKKILAKHCTKERSI